MVDTMTARHNQRLRHGPLYVHPFHRRSSVALFALNVLLLVCFPSPSLSEITSEEPLRFHMKELRFWADSGEGMGISVDIPNALPYLAPPNKKDDPGSDFSSLCASVTSSSLDSCKDDSECASNAVCTEKVEFLASRSVRLGSFWNATMNNFMGKEGGESSDGKSNNDDGKKKKGFGVGLGELGMYRKTIPEYVAEKRLSNPDYRVLDIGGLGGGGWSWDFIDAILGRRWLHLSFVGTTSSPLTSTPATLSLFQTSLTLLTTFLSQSMPSKATSHGPRVGRPSLIILLCMESLTLSCAPILLRTSSTLRWLWRAYPSWQRLVELLSQVGLQK